MDFLKKMKVSVLKLPPNSPDLNPIELVWRWIKDRVAGKVLRTKEEIVAEYEKQWDELPLSTYDKWVKVLPDLVRELKRTRGRAQFD